MTIRSLEEIYHDQLQDLYSACKQSLSVTNAMARAASDDELIKALADGEKGIARGMDTLHSICADHDIDPSGEHCHGMEGLVTEARAHALEESFGDDAARDVMIVTQYQRMVHYAIAGYGCLVTFANRLGHDGDAAKLKEQLDSTYDGDRRMTEIATSGLNKAAA